MLRRSEPSPALFLVWEMLALHVLGRRSSDTHLERELVQDAIRARGPKGSGSVVSFEWTWIVAAEEEIYLR
ncbi:unnamed protein product [Ectocarpus sp. 6 AP-2014]